MKSKFLQKMSRLLIVTIFMGGFAPMHGADTSVPASASALSGAVSTALQKLANDLATQIGQFQSIASLSGLNTAYNLGVITLVNDYAGAMSNCCNGATGSYTSISSSSTGPVATALLQVQQAMGSASASQKTALNNAYQAALDPVAGFPVNTALLSLSSSGTSASSIISTYGQKEGALSAALTSLDLVYKVFKLTIDANTNAAQISANPAQLATNLSAALSALLQDYLDVQKALANFQGMNGILATLQAAMNAGVGNAGLVALYQTVNKVVNMATASVPNISAWNASGFVLGASNYESYLKVGTLGGVGAALSEINNATLNSGTSGYFDKDFSPSMQTCQGHDNFSSCNLNFTTSTGQTITFNTGDISVVPFGANPDPITNYQTATQQLLSAISDLITIYGQYTTRTAAFNAMLDIMTKNLQPQYASTVVLPFSNGNTNSVVNQYTAGDFVPVSTSPVELGQLVSGYIQYLAGDQMSAISGALTGAQSVVISDIVRLLLYITAGQANLLAAYQALGGSAATPTVNQLLDFIISNSNGGNGTLVGALTFLSGIATIPHLNTITNVANLNWSAVSGQTLYDLIKGADWSNLATDFSDNSYAIYLGNALQAIVNQELYFSCAINSDGSSDASLYYATGLKQAEIKLSDQYATNAKALLPAGESCGVSETQPVDPCVLNFPELTNSAAVQQFTYQTGDIYYFAPDQASSGDNATVVNGPVYATGLGGGTGKGSLWARQCNGSSSASAYSTSQQILSLLSSITGAASDATQYNSSNATSLQGAEVNLLYTVQSITDSTTGLPPMKDSDLDYSWANPVNYPVGVLGQTSITLPNGSTQLVYPYQMGDVTVNPSVLTGFDTNFMPNLAKVKDIGQMMLQFTSCWQGYSSCKNIIAGQPVPPAIPWYQGKTFEVGGAVMGAMMGLQMLHGILDGLTRGRISLWQKQFADKYLWSEAGAKAVANDAATIKTATADAAGTGGSGINISKGGTGGITGGVDTISPKNQADLDNLSVEQIQTRTEMLIESKNFNTFQTEYNTLAAEKASLEEDNQDASEVEAKMKAYEDAANTYNQANPDDPIDLGGE